MLAAEDGLDAWNQLQASGSPRLAILDWIMPGIDGLELCRRLRQLADGSYRYVVLLTAKTEKQDVLEGLEAGADDYLTKPVHSEELRGRVRAGLRILALERNLIAANKSLADFAEKERKLQSELHQKQRLEALGTLAAGVAHEINTPLQFIGDNLRFLQDGFTELHRFVSAALNPGEASSGRSASDSAPKLEPFDFNYWSEEIPRALSQSLEGLSRVAGIVQVLKEFAHPDSDTRAHADLNKALQSTLTVCRNQIKDVAEVEQDLEPLPPVLCSIGDLNQVFLNLFVNAAHAIADVVGTSGNKGTIRVRSRAEGSFVSIAVSDTGCGIPEEIRDKIFDPFFTTKPEGEGTGQGLAISRSLIVDKHNGTLTFTSELGKGTTFLIRLPINESEKSP